MLIKSVTKTLPIPHEPEQTITIRKLSFVECEAAQVEKQRKALQMARAMGGDLMKVMQEAASTQVDQPTSTSYDVNEVLCAGIVGWSYDEPVSRENVGCLDSTTARWAFEQIVLLTDGEEKDKAKKR
jgi:hypothetical protein